MRRDAKLGLALGMLVIGFGIAFCFPRQHNFVQWQEDETTVETDGLDFLPIRAYQTEREPDATKTGLIVDGQPELNPNSSPDSNHATEDQSNSASGLSPIQAVAESAFVADASQSVRDLIVPFDGNDPSRRESSDSERADHAENEDQPVTNQAETYTVKPGDTLSGIATKVLGNTKQFMSIYEANRDVLRSPDDLRVGLKLRIPITGTPRAAIQNEPSTEQSANNVTLGEIETEELGLDHEDAVENETTQAKNPSSSTNSGGRFQRPRAMPFLSESRTEADSSARHTVRSGDTLEGISMKYFGHPRGVRALQQANPKVSNPKRLRLGMTLDIPTVR